MIKVKDPVRDAFTSLSTGSNNFNGRTGFYSSKSLALNAFDGALQNFGYCLDRDDWIGFDGNEGRKKMAICDEFNTEVGAAVFSWFRMESGRYEVIGYIA